MLKHWKRIIGDTIIVLIITSLGSFMFRLALGSVGVNITSATKGLTYVLFIIISGIIIGYNIRDKIENKFNYVTLVGIFSVIACIILIFFFGGSFTSVIFGSIALMLSLWFGLAISYQIVKVMK